MLTMGEWGNLVSKMYHMKKKGSSGEVIGHEKLQNSGSAWVYTAISSALVCRSYTGGCACASEWPASLDIIGSQLSADPLSLQCDS